MTELVTPTSTLKLAAPYERDVWLDVRNTGVGGSDAATVLGMNPYKSAFELWLEKRNELASDNDEHGPESPMYWGHALEDDVAQAFELVTGLKTIHTPGVLVHVDRTWQLASPDRFVFDGDELVGILEVKTTGLRNSHEWDDDELPVPALLQTQHYMSVTGLRFAWVAALIAGQKFVHKELEPDADVQHMLVQAEQRFWQRVIDGDAPPPDGSPHAGRALRERYPQAIEDDDDGVVLSPDDRADVDCIRDIDKQVKILKQQREELAQRVQQKLGEHALGYYDDRPLVRWSNVTTQRLDTTALKQAHPDIAAEFTKQTHSRRFTIVSNKE